MKNKLLIIFTLIVIPQIGFMSHTDASQCITGRTLEDQFNEYDYIFSGKVISINILEQDIEPEDVFPVDDNGEPIEPDLSLSLTPTEVTLQVFHSWKGNITDQIIVKPFVTMEPLGFEFIDGKSYLVFAENIEWSSYPVVTGCSNTKPLSQAYKIIQFVEELVNSDSQSEKHIEVNYNDFRDTSGEIICKGYSSGGGFLEYPECGSIDQFVIHILIIVLPIAGIVTVFVIWRKRK